MNIYGSVLKFGKMLMAYILDFLLVTQICLSTPSKCSLEVWRILIDNLTVVDVSFFFFFFGIFVFKGFCGLVFFLLWVLCDIWMSLNPWLGCEEYVRSMPRYLSFLLRLSCISSCMLLSYISAL